MTDANISLEDSTAIHTLLSRYCHSIDAFRADLCAGLFADNAKLHTPVGNAEGKAAIREWIDHRLALREEGMQVRHYVVNILLAAVAIDLVRARSMLIYTKQALDGVSGVQLLSTGIYEDEIVRTPAGWKFSSRTWEITPSLDDIYFS